MCVALMKRMTCCDLGLRYIHFETILHNWEYSLEGVVGFKRGKDEAHLPWISFEFNYSLIHLWQVTFYQLVASLQLIDCVIEAILRYRTIEIYVTLSIDMLVFFLKQSEGQNVSLLGSVAGFFLDIMYRRCFETCAFFIEFPLLDFYSPSRATPRIFWKSRRILRIPAKS